jgi:hypothetical protein
LKEDKMRYLKYGLFVMTVLALALAGTTAFAKKIRELKMSSS